MYSFEECEEGTEEGLREIDALAAKVAVTTPTHLAMMQIQATLLAARATLQLAFVINARVDALETTLANLDGGQGFNVCTS